MTVTLPPGPAMPAALQTLYALAVPRRGFPRMRARFGDAFSIAVPGVGRALVISDPAEVRQLFQTATDDLDNLDRNLGRVLGPGSLFALRGEAHRRQRKLLVPPFHGRRLAAYQQIMEEEAAREIASWPQDQPFATMPSMMRITLNIILRAVFGAGGAELAQLRELLPRVVKLGSVLAGFPVPDLGRWGPWGRFRRLRAEYDGIVERLIATAELHGLDGRDDILAMMLQCRYDDGTPMSHGEIADQLLTLLSAGHETTATTLAWAVERLSRHPDVLRELVAEADAGGSALRQATITETQRTRPVIEIVGRQVKVDELRLGRWTLPRGTVVLVGIGLLHDDPAVFPAPSTFDPSRFLDGKADLYRWVPFGGGVRRCLGAAFATMELDVVLRTLLRDVTLLPTAEPPERWHSRGIANAPARGGRAVVRRRPGQDEPADSRAARARR
jgi:cytochrome P450